MLPISGEPEIDGRGRLILRDGRRDEYVS